MADALQIAASGLLAQQWRLDSLANDLANVNTPGYRSTRIAFSDLVDDRGLGGVAATAAGRSARAGAFADSENPLAVALTGPGFLQVTLAGGGTALTRSGDLRLDAARDLVLPGGERLAPPIKVPAEVPLEAPAPDELEPRDGGLFVPTAASGPARPATATRVQQGVLEASNVDMATAMVELVEAQHAFDLASRVVRTQDQLLEIANGIRR
jgi:flagellar basal-body rod protein FlgG